MYHIYSKLGRGFLICIFFSIMVLSRLSAQLPSGFTFNVVQEGYTAPMGVVFSSNGNSMFTWEKSGKVYVSKWNGTAYIKQLSPVLDITDEVGNWRDFGLFSICLDPDFDQNGLLYLYYVVDRHHLLYAGTSQYNPSTNEYYNASIGRVTRYRLNLGTTITTDYSSRKILIGESKTTGIPLLHESHMGGTLVFGRDRTLLLSTGDGASYNSSDIGNASETYYQQALLDGIIRSEENVGAFRSQMVNSLSGKILRFDPNTGEGITSNPFFDAANPRSPKSRMWAMGFRNPFRMSLQPNTGSITPADADPGILLVGDVGWGTWEELEIINTRGLNCGWPLFEGEVAKSSYMNATTINQDEGQQFKNLCLQPTSFTVNPIITDRRLTHYRPSVAWNHGTADARVAWFNGTTPTDPQVGATGSPTTGQIFRGNCAIGGVYYTGTAFGTAYQNTYFFGDYGTNMIKVANLNTAQPWISNISNFASENFTNGLVDMEQNPLDNSIFYININTGQVLRISMGTNLPPVAVISSDKVFGPSPLNVNFSSAGSVDPEGGPLQYLWNFGDGLTSTLANPSHTFSGTGILSFTVNLTVTDLLGRSSSTSMVISINNTPPVAKIDNPVNNSTYSIVNATQITLAATVTDNETTTGMQYAWQVILRHNEHEHREPVVTEVNPTVQISPAGCDGDTYYYLIQLAVTDNGGLVAKDSVKIYPNCTVAVTGVTVNPTSATLTINSTQQLTAIIAPTNATNKNVTWTSNNGGVATVSSSGLVTAISAGTATITVTTQDGNKMATCIVTVSPALPGSLTGSGLSSSATVNLSTEGTADWAHWSGYDHKSTGGSQISNYVVVGTGAVLNDTNDPRTCTWSDGTPAVSGSNRKGIYITGVGNGFKVTTPADLTSRTVKVYVGGWKSRGTLTAQLSDGSSANYVNSSFSGTAHYDAVYTLTYKAASAGKLLTVTWVQTSGTGNVTLQAATLVTSPLTYVYSFNGKQ
ncbi:MAG: Ig-like domain-containing protein [Ginsengibacter sp.]